MKEKHSLLRQFMLSLTIYTLVVLALWFAYHTITERAIRESERERVILATDNLTQQISSEFERMNAAASAIAGSEYTFDFLRERDNAAYYEKATTVSEIIRRSAYPLTSADSVVAVNRQGRYYRFSGGLSNQSLEILGSAFDDTGTVFTIREIDGVLFFCHSVPVIDYTANTPARLGNILMLTGLDRTSRMLDAGDSADRMVIRDNIVMISNNPKLEGLSITEAGEGYEAFLTVPVSGTYLSVAAAIPHEVLYPENTLFLITALASLGLMLAMIATLYGYLSQNMIRPMTEVIAHIRKISGGSDERLPEIRNKAFGELASDINKMLDRTDEYNCELIEERQKLFDSEMARKNMRMSLLASQMDSHFVVNTLKSIKRLSDTNKNDKAGEMADGLGAIIKHMHAGDALVNVFDDFIILKQYVGIMNMKFDGKFVVQYDVEDALEACLMPGFILQPIVENALMHGLQNKESDARLTIKGYLIDGSIIFEISDNGVGIKPDKLQTIQDSLKNISDRDFPEPGLRGVALTNIQRRIHIKCGDEYGIKIESELGKGTTVTVTLPAVPDDN